ncbi:MAG: hypothetical protein ACRCXC_04635 [Legionella sp.]
MEKAIRITVILFSGMTLFIANKTFAINPSGMVAPSVINNMTTTTANPNPPEIPLKKRKQLLNLIVKRLKKHTRNALKKILGMKRRVLVWLIITCPKAVI